jgi:hypothetical protein
MAKIKNSVRINLSGLSIDQLVNIGATELKGYDRDNLARIVTKLDSAANKRLVRLEKGGYNTPAMRSSKMSRGDRFSVKGKNLKELRAQYIQVSNFLKSETSTVKGYKKFLKRIKKSFENKGVKIGGSSAKDVEDFLDKETRIYDWLKERNPLIEESGYKYEAMMRISEFVNKSDLSESSIKRRMSKWLKKTYEEEQKRHSIDTSNFFDITEEDE